MIQIDHLTFGYSKKRLLFEDLNLTLKPGHIYGLLGKNGAGKSTLLKNITGLAFPLKGSCTINGRPASNRTPDFLEDLFLIPEEIWLPPVSIREFISNTAGFYPKFSIEDFDHYLNEFELEKDVKLDTLSFGQQKKVMISFGLATNTDVLIMDEPTNGLDIPSKVQFRKIIAAVLTEHRCILISTHQVRDLDNLIDSLIVIHNRKIILNLSTEMIAEKLLFSNVSSLENDDILYSERGINGHQAILSNAESRNSKIDLELLFNGIIIDNSKIIHELN